MTTKHDKQPHLDHFDKPMAPSPGHLEELTIHSRELGKIGMWLYEFAQTEHDTTYLLFLRLLADYRHLQAQNMDDAVDRQEKREWEKQSGERTEMPEEVKL